MKENISIHFIDEKTDKIVLRPVTRSVPRVGDEIRVGGEGSEKYFTVTRVVWVYDEPESPFERVNVGIAECV